MGTIITPALPSPTLTCRQVRPLWTLGGATAWLRLDQESILRYIEDGRLEWAWDIGARRGGRRIIRVWFRSLEAAKARLCGRESGPAPALNAAQVARAVIGHARPTVRGAEAQGILNCDRNLVAALLAAKELRLVSALQAQHSSPVILRESLEAFLRRRRIL